MGYGMLARISNSRCRRSVRELVQNVESRSEVKWISEQIGQHFIVKDRGTLGRDIGTRK